MGYTVLSGEILVLQHTDKGWSRFEVLRAGRRVSDKRYVNCVSLQEGESLEVIFQRYGLEKKTYELTNVGNEYRLKILEVEGEFVIPEGVILVEQYCGDGLSEGYAIHEAGETMLPSQAERCHRLENGESVTVGSRGGSYWRKLWDVRNVNGEPQISFQRLDR